MSARYEPAPYHDGGYSPNPGAYSDHMNNNNNYGNGGAGYRDDCEFVQ